MLWCLHHMGQRQRQRQRQPSPNPSFYMVYMYDQPVTGQSNPHGRPARRWVAHVDMDAFFASVEQRDDPALRGLPVVVANSPLPLDTLRHMAEQAAKLPHPPEYIRGVRGVVASASYEARAFGVRSAMPLARALVLCPHAVVLPGRFERYRQVAEQLRRVWAEFSPVVEPVSLDEAYLDLTNSQQAGDPIRLIGERLKARILEETALTASVGIAPNKLVAKIASDLQKPDGLVIVEHGTEAAVLAPLHVRALPGIGPRTAEALRLLGIATLGELATADEHNLAAAFGADHAASLQRRARGEDDAPVQPPGDPRSISREVTLAEDLSDPERLKPILRSLAGRVARTLQKQGFCARCVYIKLRLLPANPHRTWRPERSDYGRLMSRQHTLPVPTDSGQTVYDVAARMLDQVAQSVGLCEGRQLVRLIGVGVASLVPTTYLLPPVALRQSAFQDGTSTPTST